MKIKNIQKSQDMENDEKKLKKKYLKLIKTKIENFEEKMLKIVKKNIFKIKI